MKNGGPAFPRPIGHYPDAEIARVIYSEAQSGMSLRDYFAAQALTGLLSRDLEGNTLGNNHVNHAYVRPLPNATAAAGSAYKYADAMLAERGAKS